MCQVLLNILDLSPIKLLTRKKTCLSEHRTAISCPLAWIYVISINWLCLLQNRCNKYIIMVVIKLQKKMQGLPH